MRYQSLKTAILLRILTILAAVATAHADEPPAGTGDDTGEYGSAYEPAGAALHLLGDPPEGQVPHSRNWITIDKASLSSGWVGLAQCHENMNAFPRAEIVYRYHDMRGLKIRSTERIQKAWVDGQSVQLEQVQRDARLCIEADVRILREQDDGDYLLRNGPFHRKFFDGYFPFHVSAEVSYPPDVVRFRGIDPPAQPGFTVTRSEGRLKIEAWFTGELIIESRFSETASSRP